MKATKEEVIAIMDVTRESVYETVMMRTIDMLREAAPHYKKQSGDFALHNIADTLAKQVEQRISSSK